MGFIPKGMMVPMLWHRHFADFRLLFICLLFVSSDAALLLDFPDSYTCLDDGIKVSKPDTILLNSWENLHLVDPSGGKVEICDLHADENNVIIPETCINYEAERKVAYVSFEQSIKKNLVYKITCHNYQADSPYDGQIIECGKDFMTVKIPRMLSGFSDEAVAEPPISTWMLVIHNGNQLTKVSVAKATEHGYTLTSDDSNFIIHIQYNALGIDEHSADGQKFYSGEIELILEKLNPKITIDVKIACARGPFPCNNTHMIISIPSFVGNLQFIDNIAVNAHLNNGLTSQGTKKITISKEKLKVSNTVPKVLYLPSLNLILLVDDVSVVVNLSGECNKEPIDDPVCSKDGFMTVEVLSLQTRPSLNLDTVILGNGQCKPQSKTDSKIMFRFSLKDCGTQMRFEGGGLVYENELRALWKDYPRKISRDSELRKTIRCRYNVSDGPSLNMTVLTPPPPVSERDDGPITFVLNLYHDDSYGVLYQDNQYPVVKTLRDPIYLEVQVLNRNDPNIELVLNDCWASMSSDPSTFPQWNIVVDGCEEKSDNYMTVFHQVSNVALPKLRKRFEVKAFAFILGDDLTTSVVFFHCSALICSTQSPDYPLCTKSCAGSRRKRDELFLNRHSVLASLPGPLVFVDSDPDIMLQDENNVIQQITLGVLPAFGIVAVTFLIVVLVSIFKQKAKQTGHFL